MAGRKGPALKQKSSYIKLKYQRTKMVLALTIVSYSSFSGCTRYSIELFILLICLLILFMSLKFNINGYYLKKQKSLALW